MTGVAITATPDTLSTLTPCYRLADELISESHIKHSCVKRISTKTKKSQENIFILLTILKQITYPYIV